VADTNGNSSQQLDVAPLSAETVRLLAPGQSIRFSDAVTPFTLTTLSADTSGALVDITFDQPDKLDVGASAGLSTRGASSINVSAMVKNGQLAVPGASVTFTIKRPTLTDSTTTVSGTTDSSGSVAVSYKVNNKKKDPPGTYRISVEASKNGVVGTATVNVIVQ